MTKFYFNPCNTGIFYFLLFLYKTYTCRHFLMNVWPVFQTTLDRSLCYKDIWYEFLIPSHPTIPIIMTTKYYIAQKALLKKTSLLSYSSSVTVRRCDRDPSSHVRGCLSFFPSVSALPKHGARGFTTVGSMRRDKQQADDISVGRQERETSSGKVVPRRRIKHYQEWDLYFHTKCVCKAIPLLVLFSS